MKKYLLVFLLVLFISGCSNPVIKNETPASSALTRTEAVLPYADPISINDAVKSLKEHGLKLDQTDIIKAADFTFDGITPAVYEINNSGHYLLIYDYKTIGRLKEAGWYSSFLLFNDRYYPDVEPWFSRPFTAKNILLIIRMNTNLWSGRNGDALNDAYKNFSQALYELNDGRTYSFAGHSKNFDARLKVTGFKYWYKDEKGCNHLEQESQQKWYVRYAGPNPDSIHDLHYSLRISDGTGSSGGSMHGSDILEKEDNQYVLRLSDHEDSCPSKDTVYTLKIKLNDQKVETLELRNIQPTLSLFMNESFNAAFLKSLE